MGEQVRRFSLQQVLFLTMREYHLSSMVDPREQGHNMLHHPFHFRLWMMRNDPINSNAIPEFPTISPNDSVIFHFLFQYRSTRPFQKWQFHGEVGSTTVGVSKAYKRFILTPVHQ